MTPSFSDSVFDRLADTVASLDPAAPRYELLEELGRGGMGTVYRAHDRTLGRDIAIKVLNPQITDEKRLIGEARITARLEHPGIVPVHDAGALPDGRLFYAMKLVRGQRLDAWMANHASMNERLSVFVRICEPVAFAHAAGVVHRDLKPGNIMIGGYGEVLVLDWGIATDKPNPQHAGTPGFMPPESLASVAGDVFSLGKVLESLISDFRTPRPLKSIVKRATAASAELRYGAALDLAADVSAFLAREPVSAHRENLRERAARLASRHRTLLALILAYLIMRAGLIFFPWRG